MLGEAYTGRTTRRWVRGPWAGRRAAVRSGAGAQLSATAGRAVRWKGAELLWGQARAPRTRDADTHGFCPVSEGGVRADGNGQSELGVADEVQIDSLPPVGVAHDGGVRWATGRDNRATDLRAHQSALIVAGRAAIQRRTKMMSSLSCEGGGNRRGTRLKGCCDGLDRSAACLTDVERTRIDCARAGGQP